jgi:hypothetical protein
VLLIANRYYDQVRKSGKNLADIDQAHDDLKNMKEFFTKLNFEIFECQDCDNGAITDKFNDFMKQCRLAHTDKTGNTRLFAFVYYSGHGVTDASTQIVLNADEI